MVDPTSYDATFQFQTGSIRSLSKLAAHLLGAMFRFQTGSIRSCVVLAQYSLFSSFRFQTGSIRSVTVTKIANIVTSFDSKLVRLEALVEGVRIDKDETVSIPNWFD